MGNSHSSQQHHEGSELQQFLFSEEEAEKGIPLFLTATQSCMVHGWTNPQRILTWKQVRHNKSLTFKECLKRGLQPSDLHTIQPNVQRWIESGKITLEDVPHMLLWPLHPVHHLRGDISDLATQRYDPCVLQKLGINYQYMRSQLLMDDDWMKMLKYKPFEWHQFLSFDNKCAEDMGDLRVFKVFGMDVTMIKLAMHGTQ